MQSATQIQIDRRNGNLHIKIDGIFTTDTAARLTITMAKTYPGKGNIFIHTEKIEKVMPEAKYTFTNLLNMSGLPATKVYLTGKNGLKFCHDMGKVIVQEEKKHEHGSCGKCKNCNCHKRKAA